MIPIAVVLAIFDGATQTIVVELITRLGGALGQMVWGWDAGLSRTWSADPWVWRIPFILAFIWWCRRPMPRFLDPGPGDSPHRQPQNAPVMPPTQPPLPTPAVHSVPKCQSSRIWCHGGPGSTTHLSPMPERPLVQQPISGRGSLAPDADRSHVHHKPSNHSCHLCDKHLSLSITLTFANAYVRMPSAIGLVYLHRRRTD